MKLQPWMVPLAITAIGGAIGYGMLTTSVAQNATSNKAQWQAINAIRDTMNEQNAAISRIDERTKLMFDKMK